MATPTILDDLITAALAEGVADPDDVAADVVARMTPFEREQIVRDLAYRRASRALTKHSVVQTVPRPATLPRAEHEIEPMSAPVRPVPLRPARSAKVAGIRDWWQNFVSEPVTIAGRALTMGECSAADLDVLSRYRREQAVRLSVQADKLDVIAQQMREIGAATVRELPRQHVQHALSA